MLGITKTVGIQASDGTKKWLVVNSGKKLDVWDVTELLDAASGRTEP